MRAARTATAARRPRIVNSRPMMISAIHGEARSTATSATSAPVTSSLSAVVSRNDAEPRGDAPAAGEAAVEPVGGGRDDRTRSRRPCRSAFEDERHHHRREHDAHARAGREQSETSAATLKVPASTGVEATSEQGGGESRAPQSASVGVERGVAPPRARRRGRRARSACLDLGDQRPAPCSARVTPRPASSTAAAGSPASSPHTPTQRPCAAAASTVACDQAQHGGLRAGEQRRRGARRRARRPSCTGSGRWCRPRRSRRASARLLGGQRGGGDLDHDPELERRVDARWRRAPRRAARAPRATSPSVATIGNITLTGCSAATRRIARSCVARSSGRCEREADAAHAEERVGLGRHGQRRQRLVGAGVERAHDRAAGRRAPRRSARRRLGLLVLVGQLRRGRGTGTRCAAGRRPRRRARRPVAASAARAEVGEDLDRACRRACAPGSCARSRAARAALGAALAAARSASRQHVLASRVDLRAVPASPSSSSGVPSAMASTRVAEPDHGGQAERAGEDRRVRGGACRGRWRCPRTSSGSSAAASAGVSSSATTMPGSVGAGRRRSPRERARRTRRPTSSTSAARSRSSGSSSAAVAARPTCSAASCHARSAVAPPSIASRGGLEQRLVVEQRQVGVEDRRLGLAGARRRPPRGRARSPRARPRSPRPGARARARAPSAARSGGGAGRRRRAGARARWRRRPRPGRPRARRRRRGAWTAAAGAWATGAAGGGAPSGATPSPKPSSASARSAVERLGAPAAPTR